MSRLIQTSFLSENSPWMLANELQQNDSTIEPKPKTNNLAPARQQNFFYLLEEPKQFDSPEFNSTQSKGVPRKGDYLIEILHEIHEGFRANRGGQ